MSEETKPIGVRIAEFRKLHRLDQAGFGQGCGYSRKTIQGMEAGRKNPSPEGLERIERFMRDATKESIDALRGPGVGHTLKESRRGSRLRADELDRVELNRMAPDELDDELGAVLKKF